MSAIDLRAFNTDESARDVDKIRESLGLGKITLFGSSYGSHLGLACLSVFPQHVERAVLTKVEGLEQTWKYPHSIQAVLDQLDADCRQDPHYVTKFQGLKDAIVRLREKLRTERIEVTIRDAGTTDRKIVLSEYEFMMAISNWMADVDEMAMIPSRIVQFLEGDWQALAEFARENRRVSIQAMPLLMDCASGASRERMEQIERERLDPENLLQDGLISPFFPESCRACGDLDLGDGYRTGRACSVPILFVSGTLDVRTPPSNVEAIIGNYPNAAHVIVRNAGHDSRELMSVEYRRLLQGFLRGDTVRSCEFTLPRVLFQK